MQDTMHPRLWLDGNRKMIYWSTASTCVSSLACKCNKVDIRTQAHVRCSVHARPRPVQLPRYSTASTWRRPVISQAWKRLCLACWPRPHSNVWRRYLLYGRNHRTCLNRPEFGRRTHPFGRRTHPMESSILRLTRAVQNTSGASTPQNVSGLAVGQGSHARIFVDLRLCGDRSAFRVLTPRSAPDATLLTSSKLRFWHALEGKIKEEKTFRHGSWTVNCKLTTEKVCFFFPEGRSSEIARYAAAGCTDCEKINRVHSTMYRPEVSKCHVALKQRKALNFCGHAHAYLAIKASISARNAAKLCSDLLD